MKSATLLLYLNTGGGHRTPARAVADVLERRYGGETRVLLVDGLTGSPPFARFIIEDGYRILQSRAPWAYEFLYAINKIPLVARLNSNIVSGRVIRSLRDQIGNERPSRIVIFHFFLIEPVFQILGELGLAIPVVTVVTDPFTAHPLWFLRRDQQFVIFSDRLKRAAMQLGVGEDRLHVFPFILSDRETRVVPERQVAALKQQRGFPPDRQMVLLLGGADGIPHGMAIMKRVLRSNANPFVVLVCGKNKELERKALRLSGNNANLKVFGYVDFVADLLICADVVVTKCGASTLMEILGAGKPPIVTSYLWEQEKGNMEYLMEGGLGFYEPRRSRLTALIDGILGNGPETAAVKSRVKELRLENGVHSVAEFVMRTPARDAGEAEWNAARVGT